jgi:hypothetical protein
VGLRRAAKTHRLEDIPAIGEAGRRVLRALSIVTVDELQSAYLASPAAFAHVLPGVDLEQALGEMPMRVQFAPGGPPPPRMGFGGAPPPGTTLPETIPVEWFHDYLSRAGQQSDFPPPLAEADAITRATAAGGAGGPPPPGGAGDSEIPSQVNPPIVNLISRMKPVRNQGLRYTCTAHAVEAVMEFHLRCDSLSPQYIYWKAKDTDGSPNSRGTWISNCIQQMVTAGSAREETWPYNSNEIPGNEGQGPPPDPAVEESPSYRLSESDLVAPRLGTFGISSTLVMQRLALGVPVAISVVSPPDLWQNDAQVRETGIFTMPLPGTDSSQAHSVCAVGYGLDNDFAGGGYIIFRNSWGTEYYRSSPFGAGYGLLPTAYLDEWGIEAFGGPPSP